MDIPALFDALGDHWWVIVIPVALLFCVIVFRGRSRWAVFVVVVALVIFFGDHPLISAFTAAVRNAAHQFVNLLR